MNSKSFSFPARPISFDDSWDVIVMGGGPAGCAAAIAAAEEGAKTLLIEGTGALGGAGTTALVPTWCPFSDQEKVIYRGLAQKIMEASKKDLPHIEPGRVDWVPIDPEKLKRIYDDLVLEAGVEVLFQTTLASVEMTSAQEVNAIVVANKAGLTAYKAKVFIDCTGDADLAAWAGALFQKGDEDGTTQPATHCFILSNVNEEAYHRTPSLHPNNKKSLIYDILASGKYPEIPDAHICNTIIGPGTVGFNAGHLWKVDNTDPKIATKALIKGRKMAEAFRRALAEYVPEVYGQAFLVATGTMLGVRETRRIIGDYMLSLDDYLSRRSFPDEICRNSYFIDLHFTKDEAIHSHKIDVETRFDRYGKGESHGIPYRCLTPRGLFNVLVAGRSISCERIVHGSIRVMPVCLAMGEAAGVAAAQALQLTAVDVHQVNTNQLRHRLQARGGYLPEMAPVAADSKKSLNALVNA